MKLGRDKLGILALVVINVASALGLVYTTHLVRQSTSELQQLRSESYDMQAQYGRYLLEASALGGHARIDALALEGGMQIPNADQVVVIEVQP